MVDREKLIRQIADHEGLVLHAYQDSLGYWTIGFGRMIDKRRGGGITPEEALYLLRNDVDNVLMSLYEEPVWQYVKGDDVRARVIADMAFNLGVAGLRKFKRMIAAMSVGDWETAAQCGLDSKWAGQVKGRAVTLMNMLRTGEDA